MAVEANTDLIEAALMYMNKTADEQTIAEELELIDQDYLDSDATESFKTPLSDDSGSSRIGCGKRAITIQVMKLFRTEEYDTAIENLEKAFKYDATNGEALYNLAQSYNRSGDTDKAVETYKKVIELFPNTEKARKSENYIKGIGRLIDHRQIHKIRKRTCIEGACPFVTPFMEKSEKREQCPEVGVWNNLQ